MKNLKIDFLNTKIFLLVITYLLYMKNQKYFTIVLQVLIC